MLVPYHHRSPGSNNAGAVSEASSQVVTDGTPVACW